LEKDWQDPDVSLPIGLKENTKKYTADFAAQITGVAAEEIIRLAELFATAKTGVVIYGNGLTQQANAVANVHAVWNLALLTGNVDKTGCGILPLMNSNNMQGSIDMGMATELLPGHAFLTDSPLAKHFASLWKCPMPEEPGLTLPEMLDHIGDSIRALYVVGENLVRSVPNATALNKLDFMIIQELFMTETAQLANVVLPACSFAEKEGTFTNLERRVQRVRAAIPPLGECKPDYEIISLLAAKMGAEWNYKNAQQIFSEICTVVPMYADLNYDALQAPGGAIWPAARAGVTYSFAHVDSAVPSVEAPDAEFPFSLIIGRGTFHRMTGTLVERSFTLDKEEMVGIVEVNTDDAKALKLRSGWNVKIKTRHGEVLRQVVVTRAVSPGTLYAPIHHKDGKTLALAAWAIEPTSKIPQIKVCAARLEMV
jgi:predicted molibdopterin-dependent oxidoreductase YjgC